MMVIGLTGPTGAGKTTLCSIWQGKGAAVIEADKTARTVTEKGSAVLQELAREFGDDIIQDGELDRRELGRRAFKDKDATHRLNEILLPVIKKQIALIIDDLKNSGQEVVVLDAPTLFEAECEDLCDVTVALLSEPEGRLDRIMERDSLLKEDALQRLSAGKPDEFYISRADHVIYNNGDEKELSATADKLYNCIVK